ERERRRKGHMSGEPAVEPASEPDRLVVVDRPGPAEDRRPPARAELDSDRTPRRGGIRGRARRDERQGGDVRRERTGQMVGVDLNGITDLILEQQGRRTAAAAMAADVKHVDWTG